MVNDNRIYIFLCDRDTRDEVLAKQLVGTTFEDWNRDMTSLGVGHPVLIYDYDKYEFLGPFEIMELQRGRPFDRGAWGGKYPAQARVRLVGHQQCVSLSEILKRIHPLDLMRSSGEKPRAFVTGSAADNLREFFGLPARSGRSSQHEPAEAPRSQTESPGETQPTTTAVQAPMKYKTKQGFDVASKAERAIADLLAGWSIECFYDNKVPEMSGYRYDFYLPQHDIYIEYWGLEGDLQYDRRRSEKKRLYNRLGLRLIELVPADETDLEGRLRQELRRFGVLEDGGYPRGPSWVLRVAQWVRRLFSRKPRRR